MEHPSDYEVNNIASLFRQGRYDEAENFARQLTERFPRHGFGWNALGAVYQCQGHEVESLAPLQQAILLSPEDAEPHYNLCISLHRLGKISDAEVSVRRALEINPNYAKAHCVLGVILSFMGRLMDAEAHCYRALEINPNYETAHSNLGFFLEKLGRLTEAEDHCRRALKFKPDLADAHNNLGVILERQGRLAEAEASYRRALEIKPDHTGAYSNLLLAMNFAAHHYSADHLEDARKYGHVVAKKARSPFSFWQCAPHPERLRIGLVSGDLCNHPVGFFLESILTHINPSQIELIAYTTGYNDDDLTSRIKPHFSNWTFLTGQSDEDAARRIHADGVHLLLDLSGHTAMNRLPIFAWRPAPVQLTWLGYFASTGVREMDYWLGDPYVMPENEEHHFTERVRRLPETYLCFTPPTYKVKVNPLPALLNGYITFGSFNNLTKINNSVVELWAKVLNAVRNSKLFLKAKQLDEKQLVDKVLIQFAELGISCDRLILEGRSPRAELLASYNRVDIALDPFPYPGGTTSAEALWMGVPVLTKRGNRFLSHIGESIAYNTNQIEWIANDEEDYIKKAIQFSSDLDRLAKLRMGLRDQVLAAPLFNPQRFAQHFEEAMWSMWNESTTYGEEKL